MAKSRKTTPRKKTGPKKPPADVVDAEVVLPDAEPQDLEVDDTPLADPATMKALDEADAVLADAKDASDTAEAADKDAARDMSEKVDEKAGDALDGAISADEMKVDEPVEVAAEAGASPATEPVAPVAEKSGGVFGSVIGGVIAGGIGFGIAMLVFPEGWRTQDDTLVTQLQQGLGEQAEKLGAQAESLTALTGQVGDLGDLSTRLGDEIGGLKETVTDGLAQRTEEISAVADRLQRLTEGEGMIALPEDVQLLLNAQKERIEGLSSEVSGIAAAAQEQINGLSTEVAGMAASAKAQMDAALAEQETAEQAEARVKARGALQAVRLALVSGDPFAEALVDIAPATEVPAELEAVAAAGAPTVAALVGDYPSLARSALSLASQENTPETTGGRLGSFFADQFNARSLTPQEGDSANAILSRVEAAVKSEDLETALSEIEGLSEAPKAEFADWVTRVEARLGAVNGYEAVSDALNGN